MAERLGRFGEQQAAPRDQAIGALVWLHLANGQAAPRDLIGTAAAAEDFLWEASHGKALYGLPDWIATSLTANMTEPAHELRMALNEIEASVLGRQEEIPEDTRSAPPRSEAAVRRLLEGVDPRGRDVGWRAIRSDVPTVITTKDGSETGLLLGLYVDTGNPSQGKEVKQIGSRVMAPEFVAGVEDGHRAALALLEQLGLDGGLRAELQHIVVRGLGLREPPQSDDPPLRGRSAGLPIALTLLQRASELDGSPLPPARYAATGCLSPGGRLEPMDAKTIALKLDAVRTDGWFHELLCPPARDTPADTENAGIRTANDLRAAAEAMWGERWRSWQESLYQRSKPRETLLQAIGEDIRQKLAARPSETINPDRVLRETAYGRAPRPIADAPAETRGALGSTASGAEAQAPEDPGGSRGMPDGMPEADAWESWEALSKPMRGDPESGRPKDGASERSWDPFGLDERHALLTGGSSRDRAQLLEHHVDSWLQEALHSGSMKVPLLVEAPLLNARLAGDEGSHLLRALAGIVSLNRHPAVNEYLDKAFNQGMLLVAVQGWELLGEETARLKAALSRLTEHGNSLVIACQAAEAHALASVFPDVHTRNKLLGLSPEQVESEVRLGLDIRADAFLALMERDKRLAGLASAPALLRLLCTAVKTVNSPTQLTCARMLKDALRFALPDDGRDLDAFAAAVATVSDGEKPERIPRERLREALVERKCSNLTGAGADCERLIDKLVESAVLVAEQDVDGSAVLRFAHPVLQTASVAIHLAGLPPEKRWSGLAMDERRRPQRELLLELCCGMAKDPEEIVDRLLEDSADPWGIKLLRAAQCLRETAQPPRETTSSVVARLATALAGSAPLAEKRYLADGLASLVEAGFEKASEAARRAMEDRRLEYPLVTRLAVSLNRSGDRRGMARLMDMAQDAPVGPAAAALDALGEQDSSDALLLLEGLLASRRCDQRLPLRTSALEDADQTALTRLADLLRDLMVSVPARQALASAIAAIPAAQGIALAAASDRRVPWSVRAAAAMRLATEFSLPPSLSDLVRSPNLSWEWRARLLAATIQRGDTEVLGEAATILTLPLGQTDRSALIDAVAAAPGGKKWLFLYVKSRGAEWARHTDILVALVGSGDRDATEIADELIRGGALDRRAKSDLVLALAAKREPGWVPVARHLVADGSTEWERRVALAIRLAEEGELSGRLLRELLTADDELASLAACAELIRAYWEARESCGPLAEMVSDRGLAPGLRATIAAAYCWAARDSAEMQLCDEVIALLSDDALDPWHRGMLATAVARCGRPEHREAALEASLDAGLVELRVYRGLVRETMTDPDAPPLKEDLARRLHAALATPADEEKLPVSDAETKRELEERVGAKVALCSAPEDTRLFERYFNEDDDALASEVLERMVPFYQAIVRNEHASLRARLKSAPRAIRRNPGRAPLDDPPPPFDVDRFKAWSEVLDRRAGSAAASQALLEEMGPATNDLEAWLDSTEPEWPGEAAHRFLHGRARREGTELAYRLVLDSNYLNRALRHRLEVGDGRGLVDAAAMLILLAPPGQSEDDCAERAPSLFYGAVGAVMRGRVELAFELVDRCAWNLARLSRKERDAMTTQGLATINEIETMHRLDDDDCMRGLRCRLRSAA